MITVMADRGGGSHHQHGETMNATRPPEPPPFSPRFLMGALVVTLTLGAGSGMFYLWRIGAGADVPMSHRQIHGHSQLFGFALLFVMGIAFQALPRMLEARAPSDRTQRLVFWLMVSGVVLRNVAQPFAFFPLGQLGSFLSGFLEAASGVIFALFVAQAVAGADRRSPLPRALAVGLPFLVVVLGLSVMQGAWIAGKRDANLPGALTEPLNFVFLHGFLLAFIYGFATRLLPGLLGARVARPRLVDAALASQLLGVGLFAASSFDDDLLVPLRDSGTVLVSLSALCFLAAFGRPRPKPAAVAGSAHVAIRLALASLGLWAILGVASVAAARLTSFPARNPWAVDAVRHLFTIGFLVMLIVGIAARVVPAFCGRPLHSDRLARATYALLALGAAMRLLGIPAAYEPRLYQVGSYMGVPVVIALALFMVNIAKTVRKPAPRPAFLATLPAR